MRFLTIAALVTTLAAPAVAQDRSGYPANAGVGNSNTTSSATADAPLANPNDEHSNTVATRSSTDAARKVAKDAGASHAMDKKAPPANGPDGRTGSAPTSR